MATHRKKEGGNIVEGKTMRTSETADSIKQKRPIDEKLCVFFSP